MVKFSKPGTQDPYPVMASTAIREALADAGIGLDKVEQAFAGYCYGATTCGQRALYEVGMTGIPVINVRNACATGSTALLLARQAILAGSADCALACAASPNAKTSASQKRFQNRMSTKPPCACT